MKVCNYENMKIYKYGNMQIYMKKKINMKNVKEYVKKVNIYSGESFKINHKFNCYDRCLIYLLTCNQCRKQYVGQTVDSFRFRWNNYKCNCHKHANVESVKQQHLYGLLYARRPYAICK